MGPHSNLAEHLVECLNVVCGRYARAGDAIANPGVLGPRVSRKAQVIPPRRSWEQGPRSRVRGLGHLFGEKMSGALADEILEPGRGRVRALFVDGGNPVIALPEQRRTEQAFRALDLLVVIDPFMTATARLAHYVLPPRMMLERHDLASRDYEVHTMQRPYAQYAEPVLAEPPGSELIDDWRVFYELARRLHIPLTLDGVPLDMTRAPTTEDLLRLLTRHSSVPFEEIRAATRGRMFDLPPQFVEPGDDSGAGKFDMAPADVLEELQAVRDERPQAAASATTFRLAVRRERDVQNTMYHQLDSTRRRLPANPAYLHPDDMALLSLVDGESVEIRSTHGAIDLPARADEAVRRGVVSVPHGWGDLLDQDLADAAPGANTNVLTSAADHCDPINAMPWLTGLPVQLRPTRDAAATTQILQSS
jgi:anaerobic selenocysteine-containing dehydrogenase